MRRVLFLHEVQKKPAAKIVLRTDKETPFKIGRSLQNTLVIEDISVSKFHCIFVLVNNSWYVQDQSTNGTWINDFRLERHKQYQLQHGDIITLNDDIKFKYEVVPREKLFMQAYNDGTPPASESDFAQQAFQCGLCAEMYIKTMTLTCSHSFCKFCIEKWQETNPLCPFCAAPIRVVSGTLVLDSYIESLTKCIPKELQEHRSLLINQRNSPEADEPVLIETIELTTDDNLNGARYYEINYNHIVDFNAAHEYYCRKYGRCFLCEDGAASNSCKFKRP